MWIVHAPADYGDASSFDSDTFVLNLLSDVPAEQGYILSQKLDGDGKNQLTKDDFPAEWLPTSNTVILSKFSHT